MSFAVTLDQLQSPSWEPIYHQEILFATDQMPQKIDSPGERTIADKTRANQGYDDQEKIHYFAAESEPLEIRKKSNPFLYDFFPLESIIPEKRFPKK